MCSFQRKAAECEKFKNSRVALLIQHQHCQRQSQQRQAGVDALHSEKAQAAPAVDDAQMEAEQCPGIEGAFALLLRLLFIQVLAQGSEALAQIVGGKYGRAVVACGAGKGQPLYGSAKNIG